MAKIPRAMKAFFDDPRPVNQVKLLVAAKAVARTMDGCGAKAKYSKKDLAPMHWWIAEAVLREI